MSSVAVVLSPGGMPPSSADSLGCVSRHGYDDIAKGISVTRTCPSRGVSQVGYNGRDRVMAKHGRFF